MEAKDKSKLKIYVILCSICFLIASYGYVLNLSGFGSSGKIRKELSKIIIVFNDLSYIKNHNAKIKATYKNKGINVTYESERINTNYQFTYEERQKQNILTIKYKPNEASIVEEVIKAVIDASSIINGNKEKEIYENYKYSDFFSSNLQEHGIEITLNNGTITTSFIINSSILKKLKDTKFGEEIYVPYITYEELNNLNNELTNKNIYLLKKDTIMLYAVKIEQKIILYISDTENNEINKYETAMSAIKQINENIYKEIIKEKIKFDKNYIGSNYNIEINPTTIENNQPMNSNHIVKITIN